MKGNLGAQSLKGKIRYIILEYYSMNLRNIFIADPPKRGMSWNWKIYPILMDIMDIVKGFHVG